MRSLQRLLRLLSAACVFGFTVPSSAATFSDVPKNHFAIDAITYLSDRDIITGYEDGTFKPDKKVNRAEALKVIASAFVPKTENLNVKSTDFSDIPDNAWYLPSITWALTKRVIDGPPAKTSFYPTRAVTKSEFIKMLLVSNGVDPKSFGDIALPLSSDVQSTTDWFYPWIRYAVATSTTVISDAGLFGPNRELTRGDVALILYRYTMFKDEQRTQHMLILTRQEVERVITALSSGNVRDAEFASARGILLARGALLIAPEETAVKIAVKIAEGYRALTRAYRAGINGDTNAVLKLSADASTLAGQARRLSPDAKILADQLEKYSKSFSDQAKKK